MGSKTTGKTASFRILYLVPYAPTRIRTRPYHLIRALRQAGHQVTLLTVWENKEERQALDELRAGQIEVIAFPLTRRRIAANLLRGLMSRYPLQAWYSWEPRLGKAASQTLSNNLIDIVQVEHLRGALYALELRSLIKSKKMRIPIVWDAVDCISSLFEQAERQNRSGFGRWASRLELPRTRKLEKMLPNLFERVLVSSQNDRDAFMRLANLEGTSQKVKVQRNGVDLAYFSPDLTPRSAHTIVFTGKLSYHANVFAARFLVEQVMPQVWLKRPDIKVKLVGKDPTPDLCKLAQNDPRILTTGSVPDIRPYLRSASLAVAPIIYGAGIQNKVLEAMACGTPMVVTMQAASGFENLRSEEEALVADGADQFAQAILRLLDDENLRKKLSASALEYVHRWHDWQRIAEEMTFDYQQLSCGLIH